MHYVALVFLLFTVSLNAQKSEEVAIKKSIALFFEGLQNGDTVTIKKAMYKDFRLQSVYIKQDGTTVLHDESKASFLKAVSGKNPQDIWLEKLESYKISIDGAMAHVWTPYMFYFNNKLSHCGVNSFQLFKNNGVWQIIYIIDTRKKECGTGVSR